ncbi:DNA/RNA nuclease SfsA [Larsenimonas suaedae]|uniref:Sugar fermentation stimulation protein homolog n=1 Tax=Larsenimonas suaedae TaxID=1851019 RepID=A0ABU1GYV5_9GAMM|nr:DNA/RNA nuclease SfsA [Larsenimonas suaedae]MCM2973605.1 DNA/RNA nuclease SfsA [Larsenimonas suaedae]MDR5897025.1 DNA/RNA nuclease SfsA [Larsenimonas suaedae]
MHLLDSLVPGRLIARYKRFLADIELDDGTLITAHCPNTGSMRHVALAGCRVWVSKSDNPKRKLAWTWERIELPDGALVSVHTGRANALVKEALRAGRIVLPEPFGAPEGGLAAESTLSAEVKLDDARLDFMVENEEGARLYIEVKQVTLQEDDGIGYFPDSVSQRGQKHLKTLMTRVRQGEAAMLLFCVAHEGIECVRPARHLDPVYADLLQCAISQGVTVAAYGCHFSANRITLERPLLVESGL